MPPMSELASFKLCLLSVFAQRFISDLFLMIRLCSMFNLLSLPALILVTELVWVSRLIPVLDLSLIPSPRPVADLLTKPKLLLILELLPTFNNLSQTFGPALLDIWLIFNV
jgi:hypothetical protein